MNKLTKHIGYTLAIQAKEIGFDYPTIRYIVLPNIDHPMLYNLAELEANFNCQKETLSNPTQSQYVQYFRQERKIHITAYPMFVENGLLKWMYELIDLKTLIRIDISGHADQTQFDSYEDAIEEGQNRAYLYVKLHQIK